MEVVMDFSKALDNKDLLRAAYDLDKEMADVCLEAGISVNYRDHTGSTALHYLAEGAAVKSGDPLVVTRQGTALLDSLLSYRPDLNIPDHQGITCLHIASANNLFWLVHQLLQQGADPTIKDGLTGETPVEMFYHSILQGRKVSMPVGSKTEIGCHTMEYPDSSDLHSATTMCSPALVLNSPSPIITSLHYAHVFRRIAERCDGKVKMKYSSISRSCEQVSQDILQSCGSFMEVRHVIQANKIALLRCAVSDRHSHFLLSSFLQRHVEELWYGEAFRNAGTFSHWFIPVVFLLSPLLLPFVAIIYAAVYILFRWVYQDATLQDLLRKLKYYIVFLVKYCRYSPYVRFTTNFGMTKVYNTGAGGGNLTSLNALWINNSTSTDEFTGISVTFLNLQWAVFGLQGHNIFLSSYLPTHILCKVLLAMFLLTNLVVVSLLIVRLVSSVTTQECKRRNVEKAKTAWSSYFGEGNVFQADKADVSDIMRQMVANYQRTLQSRHVSVEDVDTAVDSHLQAVEEETKGLQHEVEDVFTGVQNNKAALQTNLETLQSQIN
ncbi:PREDICTED: uncharacterized protein LOC109486627 [Branchiostoma belcheri]|uniref:Uncharacterized protein LOC109486627 n=1 Tax=Branchiostoma belcheri TaxID=7741 RepID=A0A6P5AID9_BRABE|nr:PREDICTED: uncharacterized protein LOC109486627 [Branchiostoma belcheri]